MIRSRDEKDREFPITRSILERARFTVPRALGGAPGWGWGWESRRRAPALHNRALSRFLRLNKRALLLWLLGIGAAHSERTRCFPKWTPQRATLMPRDHQGKAKSNLSPGLLSSLLPVRRFAAVGGTSVSRSSLEKIRKSPSSQKSRIWLEGARRRDICSFLG